MASDGSRTVVLAALTGNSLIAVTKFAAAGYTGSSAMLSEAIHSVVDTGNQGLMLYGIRRAARPADEKHPFGYGMEIYFWTFVVAILIFAVGAGVSIYEGIDRIRHPEPVTSVVVNYVVLGLAFAFEAVAWWIAYKEFRTRQHGHGILETVRHSKDPTVFTVLFEDSAAMLGLVVAFLGLLIGELMELPVMDGVASVVIGLILAGTAALLAYETKGLLIGEAASPATVESVRRLVGRQRAIARINELRTMHLGPEDVLLNLSVDFEDGIDAEVVEAAVSELEDRIKNAHPEITKIFIEAQAWQAHKRRRQGG